MGWPCRQNEKKLAGAAGENILPGLTAETRQDMPAAGVQHFAFSHAEERGDRDCFTIGVSEDCRSAGSMSGEVPVSDSE